MFNAAPLRYVVLRHEGVRHPHFDLMFETSPGSPLATWRVQRWPLEPGDTLEPLPDHRTAYLDYEGPLTAHRGHVRRIAAGTHTIQGNDADVLTVTLDTDPAPRVNGGTSEGAWRDRFGDAPATGPALSLPRSLPRRTFYIDPIAGDDANDGLSPARPFKTYSARELFAGDSLLFKRGSVVRDALHTRDGSALAPITYAAYGDGDRPTFLGSVPVNDPGQWIEDRPAVWRFTGGFASEICNLIFNHGQSCGNLRWSIDDLRHPGEWHYTGIGTSIAAEGGSGRSHAGGVLYLCSPDNPASVYRSIECALWGARKLAAGRGHLVIEDLSFKNAGVHGYQDSHAHHIVFRRCEFAFIGGGVWHRERRIRFGNAIEFWDGASDITVDACLFNNIYDSGVTHQGGETRNIPERLFFRNNLFVDCGMAAYECREPSNEVYFEHNTCIRSGCGFSPQGEPPPRQSEIFPQPMGHHVFIWRIDLGTQHGHVYIRKNLFYDAPYGAAIYSIAAENDERQFVIADNAYSQSPNNLLMHFGGRSYTTAEFDRYRAECGQDRGSVIAQPQFINEPDGDYRQRPDSPTIAFGTPPEWAGSNAK